MTIQHVTEFLVGHVCYQFVNTDLAFSYIKQGEFLVGILGFQFLRQGLGSGCIQNRQSLHRTVGQHTVGQFGGNSLGGALT